MNKSTIIIKINTPPPPIHWNIIETKNSRSCYNYSEHTNTVSARSLKKFDKIKFQMCSMQQNINVFLYFQFAPVSILIKNLQLCTEVENLKIRSKEILE